MKHPYRPPTGSPRGWATREYDPHIVAPLALSSAAVADPTVWCGRDVHITAPPATAIMQGETRLGVLPARFPFKFGNIINQPVVVEVSNNWVARASAGALAPNVWLSKVNAEAVSATATAPAPAVTMIDTVTPTPVTATATGAAPNVMVDEYLTSTASTASAGSRTPVVTENSTLAFPRLGGMLIGNPHAYASNVTTIAKLDLAILGVYRGWTVGGSTPSAVVNAIKAANPNILLGNYTLMTEVPSHGDTATSDVQAKLAAEDGPGGVGDWYAYDHTGAHVSEYGVGYYDTNLTTFVTPDSNGYIFPQWLAHRDNTQVISQAAWDIWYCDNNFWQPRSVADWNRNGTDDAVTDSATRTAWRNGQRAYYDVAKALQPNKILMVNADSDLNCSVYPSGQSTFSQYSGIVNGAFLESLIGKTFAVETWGGWSQMMGWYHNVFNQLVGQKLVMFDVKISTTDYQTMRYAFGACLMNDGYFNPDDDSYYNVLWFDEYDLAGTADTKWLGQAVDPPQTSAWSNGVYRRRFANGMVLVNPKGNGSKTVTVGSGYHRINGSQDHTVNSGATVTSTVTLDDRDGLFLVKT